MKHIGKCILLVIILLLIQRCVVPDEFKPVSNYFDNLMFGNTKINLGSVNTFDLNKDIQIMKIRLRIIDETAKSIIIKNNISIEGRFLQSFHIHQIADDLSTPKVEGRVLKGDFFEFDWSRISILFSCDLTSWSNEKFSQVIKKEKFKIKLPTLIVDGREYEFEPVDFVHKERWKEMQRASRKNNES